MISRRTFNIGSSSLFLASSLMGFPRIGYTAGGQAIDVHCHVFNVTDVPVRNFIRRVVFGVYEEQALLALPRVKGLVAWLIAGLTKPGVMTAKEELERLNAGDPPIAELLAFDPYSQEFEEIITDSLDEVLSTLDPEDAQALQDALEQELRAGPNLPPGITARGILLSPGSFGRYWRWAGWLRSPRLRITRRMKDLYGKQVGAFTPSFLDLSKWLNEPPDEDSTIGDQIAVMAAVQQEARKHLNIAVHCLVPYDPWQQAWDEHREVSNPEERTTAFDLVRHAVEKQGYVGVKLYPPMGFLPAENASSGLKYPKRATEELPDFARKLDAALDLLYAWADKKNVAVLAHATNSWGAGPDYGSRASPAGWRPVLEKYPKLRLNLAHFGGFREDPDPWEEIVGSMLKDDRHLYTDLSYLSEALPSASEHQRQRIADKLKVWIEDYPIGNQRILYGSDYLMLGREPDHYQFFGAVQETLKNTGVDWSRFVRGNAIEFYGLGTGQPARERLEAWYDTVGLDRNLLNETF